MAMYGFVPLFREWKFCGVPSCVFDKLRCAAGEKKKVTEHFSSRIMRTYGLTDGRTDRLVQFYVPSFHVLRAKNAQNGHFSCLLARVSDLVGNSHSAAQQRGGNPL
jgi:hypothetical protein